MARRRLTTRAQPFSSIQFPIDASTWERVVPLLELSPQQVSIVELIMQGVGYKQIAGALDISVPTVRTQLDRIYRRLCVDGRVPLVLHIFALTLRVVRGGCHLEGRQLARRQLTKRQPNC